MSQAEQAAPVVDVESAGNAIADKFEAMDIVEEKKEEIEPSIEASSEPEESPKDDPESEKLEESEEDSSEPEEKLEPEEPKEEPTDTFESIADLAEATGMEIEDFLSTVKQKVKINGEEMEVSLKDLTAGYQMEQDYRRKTTELSEQRKGFEVEKEQAATQLQSKFQEAEMLSATLEKQLMSDYNGVNWNELELQDREEWLVQRQKYGEKAQQIEATKAQIQTELQQRGEKLQAEQQEQLQIHLAKENEALLSAIPEWSDSDTRGAEVVEMAGYLKSYGFSDEESSQISDHRIMRLIRDAYKQQTTNQKIDVIKKKVRKLPKIVKASAKTDKQAAKNRANADTWGKYKQSGTMDDLTAHLASKL